MGVMGVLGVLIELRSLRSFLVDSELKELWEFLGVFLSSREFWEFGRFESFKEFLRVFGSISRVSWKANENFSVILSLAYFTG